MCMGKSKKKRPPLKPREGPYKKTNAYTSRPSPQQLLTIFLMITLITLHSIFDVAAIITIDHSVLWIILIFHYVLLVFIIVVYVLITIKDPVDDYLLDPYLAMTDQYRVYCDLCVSFRQDRSYHCKRCNRCTQKFDHHCKYLNTCIGGKNYSLFLTLLISFIVFNMGCIGQSVWVLVVSLQDQNVAEAAIQKWVNVGIIVLAFILMALSIALCIFHMYISLCLDLSTLQFYESSLKSTSKNSEIKKNSQQGMKVNKKQQGQPKMENQMVNRSRKNTRIHLKKDIEMYPPESSKRLNHEENMVDSLEPQKGSGVMKK